MVCASVSPLFHLGTAPTLQEESIQHNSPLICSYPSKTGQVLSLASGHGAAHIRGSHEKLSSEPGDFIHIVTWNGSWPACPRSWAHSLPEDVNWELANDGRGQTTVGSALALPGLVQVWPPWPLWGNLYTLGVKGDSFLFSCSSACRCPTWAELKAAQREMVSALLCSASPTPPGHLCGVVAALQGNSCSSRVWVLPMR